MAFGDAYSGFMRLEIIRIEKLYGVSGHYRKPQAGCQIQSALHIELGMRSACALEFNVKALRKQRRPFARQRLRLFAVILGKCHTDIAMLRTRERNQACRSGFLEPGFSDFGAAAVLVGTVSARYQPAQMQVALM